MLLHNSPKIAVFSRFSEECHGVFVKTVRRFSSIRPSIACVSIIKSTRTEQSSTKHWFEEATMENQENQNDGSKTNSDSPVNQSPINNPTTGASSYIPPHYSPPAGATPSSPQHQPQPGYQAYNPAAYVPYQPQPTSRFHIRDQLIRRPLISRCRNTARFIQVCRTRCRWMMDPMAPVGSIPMQPVANSYVPMNSPGAIVCTEWPVFASVAQFKFK